LLTSFDFHVRHHLPILVAALSIAFCFTLILWGYADDLDRAIKSNPLPPNTDHVLNGVAAYHNRPGVPNVARLVAFHLTTHPVKRVVFTILLMLQSPSKSLTAYVQKIPIGSATGLDRGAHDYFGVSLQNLTTGEILLLCDHVYIRSPITSNPHHALKRRDTLLADLHRRGNIPYNTYLAERNNALSLAADHRPVY
jgi:hypothetical protein